MRDGVGVRLRSCRDREIERELARALDLFPPEDVDEEDVKLLPDLLNFVNLNGIRCLVALCTQLENNGLHEWSRSAKRNAGFWLAYFDKWTRHCEGCERTDGDFLEGLDWTI